MTISRLESNYSSVGMIISLPEPERFSWCPTCLKVSIYSKLKHRVYLDDNFKAINPPHPHADNWLQCWKCGLIIPMRELQMKGKIAGIQGITPRDNPYDFNKPKVLGTEDYKGGIKGRYQRLKKKRDKHPDKEVQNHLEQGWELVSYKEVMPA